MNTVGKTRSERVEGVVLVAILLTVGGLAGAASFTHVHDWTMANSPAGTGDWFGWANAAISELIPLAALLTIRRRRRTGDPIGYPMFLLVAAVALSLSAQLAVAKPGPSGWLLSAVPALAFLGLSKLVLTVPPAASSAPEPAPTTKPAGDLGTNPATDRTNSADQHGDHGDLDGGQAVTVDGAPLVRPRGAEPRIAPGRPGLVPIPAAAFPTRNGSPLNPSAPVEATR